jgi:choline dehydrogenase-like flavoprotein
MNRADYILPPTAFPGDPVQIDVDVVVVGSGAGGATMAAHLAEAGHDVLLLEEGGYYDTDDYTADIIEMMGKLMRGGGSTITIGRSPVGFLEGRCVGGTTIVNGGMCWRTPEPILDGWVRDSKLPMLARDRLEPHFDEVERTINAREQDPGSEGSNSLLIERGAKAMGWDYRRNKRNQVHCVGANDCVTGCPTGAKQSTLQSWLPRAFRSGARVLTHARVEKVLTERGRAVGVRGRLGGDEGPARRFTVRAGATVVCCGAIQTPLLLMRSRLARGNPHLGRNFTIHPNIKMVARFPFPVDSAFGTHQAFQVTEFQDQGVLLAPGAVPLGMVAMSFEAFGEKLGDQLSAYRYLATGGILVDDSSAGRVQLLPLGIPLVRYDVTDVDQEKFIWGAARLAELYFAAGAEEVFTPFEEIPHLSGPDDIKRLYDVKPKVERTEYFTAHLMGTCRMHADAGGGVVAPSGEVYGVPDLYLADASILPGPVGCNPQVTIMTLARLVALQLDENLRRRRAA